jgi:hypothetical protein
VSPGRHDRSSIRVGGTLAQTSAAADLTGYQRLLDFAQAQLPWTALLGG